MVYINGGTIVENEKHLTQTVRQTQSNTIDMRCRILIYDMFLNNDTG